MASDIDQLIKTVKACGWVVTRQKTEKHYKVRHPETHQLLATIPHTPSDWRALQNSRAELKRKGLLTSYAVMKRAAQAAEAVVAANIETEQLAAELEAQPHTPFTHPLMVVPEPVVAPNPNGSTPIFVPPPAPLTDDQIVSQADWQTAPELPADKRPVMPAKRGRPRIWTPELICEALALAFSLGVSINPTYYKKWRGAVWPPLEIDGVLVSKDLFPTDATVYQVCVGGWEAARDYALYLWALDTEDEDEDEDDEGEDD